MIIERKSVVTEEIKGDFEGVEASLSEGDLDLIFSIVSENFYSDIYGSIVRELASNCVDSHTEAKISDPIIIKGYNDEGTDFISFIDVGVGLGPERFKEVYMKYFKSTKRESNEYVGYFGIGSKSPLGYTDSFEVITRFEGIEYHWVVGKSETGRPRADLLNSKETEERNGTEVKIVIEPGDYEKFKIAVHKQLTYFDNIYVEGFDVDNNFNIVEGDTFKYRGSLSENEYKQEELHICFGKVVYPINWSQLGIEPIALPLGIKFGIGELFVTNNREQIVYTDESKFLIKQRIDAVIKEIRDLYNSQTEIKSDFSGFMKQRKESHKFVKLGFFYLLIPSKSVWDDDKRKYITADLISGLKQPYYSEIGDMPITMPSNPFFMFEITKTFKNANTRGIKTNVELSYSYLTENPSIEFYRLRNESTAKKDKFLLWKGEKEGKNNLAFISKRKISKRGILHAFEQMNIYGNSKDLKEINRKRRNFRNKILDSDIDSCFVTNNVIESIPLITDKWNKTKIYKEFRKIMTRELVKLTKSYERTSITDEYLTVLKEQREKKRKKTVEGIINAYSLDFSEETKINIKENVDKFKGFTLYSFRGDVKRTRVIYEHFEDLIGISKVQAFIVGKTFFKHFEGKNCMSTDEFLTTDNKMLRNVVTALMIDKRLTILNVLFNRFLENLDKFNPEIAKIYDELSTFSYKYSKSFKYVDKDVEALMKELLEISEEKGWYHKHLLDDLKELEKFTEGLLLLGWLDSQAYKSEDVQREMVDYLKYKKKKLDPIHYFIPNEEEKLILKEAKDKEAYKKELQSMREKSTWRRSWSSSAFYRTPYFN